MHRPAQPDLDLSDVIALVHEAFGADAGVAGGAELSGGGACATACRPCRCRRHNHITALLEDEPARLG
jgi:hypothetical protein